MTLTIGIDIGGTFTDTVVMDGDGAVAMYKSPTTPSALIEGVLANLDLAATDSEVDRDTLLSRVDRIAHGTTVATNAYIERRGARVALLATRGFEDTVFMPTARLVITPVNRPERWNSGAEKSPQLGSELPGSGFPDSDSMIIMRKPLKIAEVRNVTRLRWLSSAPLARPVVPLV